MVNKLYKYKLLFLLVFYCSFLKSVICDFEVIKVGVFGFMVRFKIITFVKLLYYFKHECFSFAKAL